MSILPSRRPGIEKKGSGSKFSFLTAKEKMTYVKKISITTIRSDEKAKTAAIRLKTI